MGFFDSIADIATGIAKAGFGEDVLQKLKWNQLRVLDTTVDRHTLTKFNGLDLRANKDFTLAFTDDAGKSISKKLTKGQTFNAGSREEADALKRYIESKGGANTFLGHITDKKARTDAAKNAEQVLSDYGAVVQDGVRSGEQFQRFIGREGKDGIGLGNAFTGYFEDEVNGTARKTAWIGGTSAGFIGIRYLQGGNLTTKANGERDIAGIPFI